MTINLDKLSTLIPSQLPEFIRDDVNYETFVEFIQAYYEWMELKDTSNSISSIVNSTNQGATFASKNLQEYFDVDESIDGFVDYFIRDFLPYFPEESLGDKRKVLKIARQLYENKGTLNSYKLLFRLLYNSTAETLLTGDLVFKASAGQWYIPKSLKIKSESNNWLIPELQNYRVFGVTSKSFATIESTFKNVTKFDVYISNIERVFESGEMCRIVDSRNQDVYALNGKIVPVGTPGSSIIEGKLVGAISSITINPKYRGTTYKAGDPVVVYGGLNSNTALSAVAHISETTLGAVQRVYVVNGGFGYRAGPTDANPNTSISFSGGGSLTNVAQAIAHVQTFANNLTTLSTIPLDRISIKEHVRLSNGNYFFSNVASANANTRLIDAFTFDTFDTYPISTIQVDNGGGGYSSIPTANAMSLYYDDLPDANNTSHGHVQNLGGLGILAPMQIVSGGQGYVANDRIIITNGSGHGALANVTTVTGAGAITGIEYVPYSLLDPTRIYPLGGLGYRLEDITESTQYPLEYSISSANANSHGAILTFPGIMGQGATFTLTTDRIGAITKILVTDPGEDYIAVPGISLKVQDLAVTGIDNVVDIQNNLGSLVFQGIISGNTITTSYQSFISDITVIQEDPIPSNVIYNARVYNYSKIPLPLNLLDVANTTIHLDAEDLLYPTMNLTSSLDSSLGYTNGVITYGDGNARATAKFLNGLIYGQGQYLNTVGQPSVHSIIQSEDYNDYTYELSVEQPIAKYREMLKNVLHPSGMKAKGRALLNAQKSFSVHSLAGMESIKPIQYWARWPIGNPLVSVQMAVTGNNLSTNAVHILNMDSPVSEMLNTENDYFIINTDKGPGVRSQVSSFDDANNIIYLKDSIFLTYPNVAYAYSNATLNKIVISSLTDTPNYDIINNKNYSNTDNHIEDIVFPGDNITIAGNTFVVLAVDYPNGLISIEQSSGLLTTSNLDSIVTEDSLNNILLGQYIIIAGTEANPVPFTINRSISTSHATIHKN